MRKTLIVLALFALPLSAAAEVRGFELTPHVGYRFYNDFEVDFADDIFSDSLDIDESETFGVSLAIPVARQLQVEIRLDRQESTLGSSGGLFAPSTEIGDIEVTHYHAGVIYEIGGGGQVHPYVAGSLGLTEFDLKLPGSDSDEHFSVSFAGGVKVFWSEHLGLRAEGRLYGVDLDDNRNRRRRDYDEDDALVQIEGSVGLIFAW